MNFSDIETATRYSISLDTLNSQIPENMKLYTDSAYNVEFSGYTGITELGTVKLQEIFIGNGIILLLMKQING